MSPPRSQKQARMLTLYRANNANFDLFDNDLRDDERRTNASFAEASDFIVDIREYDVPYHVRVMIDLGTYCVLSKCVQELTSYRYPSRCLVFRGGEERNYDHHQKQGPSCPG